MNISVFGAGYVGLVTAACFAEVGHQVVCCDHDPAKVQALSSGRVPFYEPGLSELVANGVVSGRLNFTRSVAEALSHARVAVLAVGTPSNTDGSTDLSQILAVAEEDANVEELVSEDNREQKDENKLDEMAIEEGDDTNLNKSKTQTNANKKKKKGKQK